LFEPYQINLTNFAKNIITMQRMATHSAFFADSCSLLQKRYARSERLPQVLASDDKRKKASILMECPSDIVKIILGFVTYPWWFHCQRHIFGSGA
jgi:hypothetical protein